MSFLKQNSKLKKEGIWSFGLTPIKTCPRAGSCKKFCYAQKGMYKVFTKRVHTRWSQDFEATKQEAFVDLMTAEIKRKRKVNAIRIHSEGDFYSQAYLDKWVAIAKRCPEIRFYCYTKSLHLDWSHYDKLKNTKRIQSIGGKLDDQIDYRHPHAVIFDTEKDLIDAGYINVTNSDTLALNTNSVKIGIVKH